MVIPDSDFVNMRSLKSLFHSSQKLTRKLAARTFIQSQYLKALAASLRVGFCGEWKRSFTSAPRSDELTYLRNGIFLNTQNIQTLTGYCHVCKPQRGSDLTLHRMCMLRDQKKKIYSQCCFSYTYSYIVCPCVNFIVKATTYCNIYLFTRSKKKRFYH